MGISEAIILELTVGPSGAVTGIATLESVSGAPPQETLTSPQVIDFSGTANGGLLVLTVNDETVFGSITEDNIDLQYHESGPLDGLDFKRVASSAPYGQAVEKMSANLQAANTYAAAVTSSSLAVQEQIDAEEGAINAAVATVGRDTAALNQVRSDLSQLAGDLTDVEQDYTNEKSDATAYGPDVCDDTLGATSDVGQVAGDAATLGNDADQLETDLPPLQRAAAAAPADWAGYQRAQAILPAYEPEGGRPPSLSSFLPAATADLGVAARTANAYIDKANALVSQAYTLATRLANESQCATAGTTPVPIGHI